jgi:hypothetical protein
LPWIRSDICGGELRIGRAEPGVATSTASDQDLVAAGGAFHPVAKLLAEVVGADNDLHAIIIGLCSGASGTRTRDLLTAGQTLSQLSYGPRKGMMSGEVYRRPLPIPRPVDAQRQPVLTVNEVNGNQEALLEVIAIGGYRINLVGAIRAPDVALRRAMTAAAESNLHNAAL